MNGFIQGLTGETKPTRVAAFAVAAAAFVLAVSMLPSKPGGHAENLRIEQAERLEQTAVDACRTSLKFENPRAKPGLTRVARSLPDGSFLVVVPFTVGKAERQARCVARADGLLEFSVERAS